MKAEEDFFKGKRPWSKIKDAVLRGYLPPYLAKVAKLGHQIILIDAFAGPGIFEKEKGEDRLGSPLIILQLAERYVHGKYQAIFMNSNINHHKKLKSAIENFGPKEAIKPRYGKAQELLDEVKKVLTNQTLFIYLDPFGLKDLEFRFIEPFLQRNISYSTEIVINISMPTLHRLATRRVHQNGKQSERSKRLNETLTKVLGGDYWKESMWDDSLIPEEKEVKVMDKYRELLHRYLPYSGSCPVREKTKRRVKYFITFCSRHKDALLLMNDFMCKAYFRTMHEIEYKGTLFERRLDWKETQQRGDIKEEICRRIRTKPGIRRKDLWLEITRDNFMRWVSTEYHDAIKQMVGKEIHFVSDTSRLNDDSKLYMLGNPGSKVSILPATRSTSIPKIYYDDYILLSGLKERLVSRVNDGSIVVRFDKTPLPKRESDVVCPHFLELKWAYGCPYDCAWCYLKGTFRFQPMGKSPVVKPYEKIEAHTRKFLEEVRTPEILNTGEIADSLMNESAKMPFSEFIIPIFEAQKLHKVLFLTKSSNVSNLLEIAPHNQAIISFSLNAISVAQRWEKAPKVLKRIEAAKKVFDAGYEVRIRIDPMAPIEKWEEHYLQLLDILFDNFTPERITLGSLRGLQSTINGCTDTSWTEYLVESSNWGKKIDFTTRYLMYSTIINQLQSKYNFSKVALCKETVEMWNALKIDYKKIKCNCVW